MTTKITGDVLLSYVQKAKEMLTPSQALQELIDNAVDANAKNISIEYCAATRTLKVTDDGHGFTEEALDKYFRKIRTHITTDSDASYTIGGGGWGGFDALCKLSHYEDCEKKVSRAVVTSYQGDVKHTSIWYLTDSEEILSNVERAYNTPMPIGQFRRGVEIEITNCYPFSKQQWETFKTEASKVYSLILNKINLEINDGGFKKNYRFSIMERIKPADKMYLNVLGDKINNDGFYLCDNLFIYNVRTFTAKSLEKEISFKAVNLFIPNTLVPKGDTASDGGVYVIKAGKRYINMGNNYSRMWNLSSQSAAVSQRRVLLLIDTQEQADLFEIKGNKGAGITNLCENQNLKEYRTKEGNTLYDALKSFYRETESLYRELNDKLRLPCFKNRKSIPYEEYESLLKHLVNGMGYHKPRIETIIKENKKIKAKKRKPKAIQVFKDKVTAIQKCNDNFKYDDEAMKALYRQKYDSLNCVLYDNNDIALIKNKWCPESVNLEEYQRLVDFLQSLKKKPWQIMEFINNKVKFEYEKSLAYSEAL